MNALVLESEKITDKERYITFHGKRILQRHIGYASAQSKTTAWWQHWINRTLYK